MGKNVIIFGADTSLSVHIDNNGKDILILGEGPTQGLDDIAMLQKYINSKQKLRNKRLCTVFR